MTTSEGAPSPSPSPSPSSEPASDVEAGAAPEPQATADGAIRDGAIRDGASRDDAPAAPEPELDALRAEGIDMLRSYVDERRGGNVYITATVHAENVAARDLHTADRRRSKGGRDAGRLRPGEDADGAWRRVSVTATSAEELQRLQEVTLPVRAGRQAAPVLERERLLVLKGPAGAGKRAAAIELLREHGPVLDIDPSVSLPALADFATVIRRPDHACYVVESLSADTAKALNEYTLRSLVRQLADTGSWLVLTVDERIPLQPDIESCTVAWRDRPEPIEALRRHLDYYLTPAMSEQVMVRLPAQELGRLLAEREMRLVDRLARSIAQAHLEGSDVDAAVAAVGLEAHEQVRRWFSEERTPSQVAFLLAAAVLGGCAFASVAAHAARIEQLLAELCRIDLDEQPQNPTRSSTELLADIMAVTAEGTLTTEFGTCVTRVVRSQSAGLLPAVLHVVWHEHDLAAEALVRWLAEAGTDPEADVRLRVAMAAGHLADFEFATVRSRLLLPWAKHPAARAGWTAADALGVPAGKEGTAPLALGLLRHWARVGNMEMVWTAAAAFGGYVGLGRPSVAMEELLLIALRNPVRCERLVTDSVARLFRLGASAGQEVPTVVLSALGDWLDPELEPAPSIARAVAVQLLRDAGDPAYPHASLTWRRLTHDEARPFAARLLREALRDKESRDPAVDALLDLVDAADVDERVWLALQQLVLDVVGPPAGVQRDADRIRHYLGPWTEGTNPSRAAVRLIDRLDRLQKG